MKRNSALVLGAALAAALFTHSVDHTREAAAGPPLPSDGSIADVAEKATPSVVNVSSTQVVSSASTSPFELDPFFDEQFGHRPRQQEAQSLGSGVIVSAKGLVLTNNHVVANAKDIKVSLTDGRDFDAEVVGADPKTDLAVLKLKGKLGNLDPVTIGDSSKMRLGDVVLAIGNPFGVGQSVTMGIVSAKGRGMGIADYEDFIQTDAAINPGNSGGALINMRGELIGINTAMFSRSGGYMGIGFAIPTNMARPIMDSLIAKGKVVRSWLGVSIEDVTPALADTLGPGTEHGILIRSVVHGGPAAKAGLKAGDVVVKIDNRAAAKASELRNAIAALDPGHKAKVEYVRGGKHGSVTVALTERPADDAVADVKDPYGQSETGPFGVSVTPLSKSLRQKYQVPKDVTTGVVVTAVSPSSPAAELNLQPGDLIIQINRTAIKTAKQLDDTYRAAKGKLAILLYRDGSTVYLVIQK